MDLVQVAAFWLVSMVFVLTPGADWAFAITAGLEARVPPAVAGLLAGHLLATFVVAAGVGALVARVPLVLTMLTIAGAIYLLWLGVGTIRHPAVPAAREERGAGRLLRWAVKGFGVSGLNPKVFLLFLALLPQFARATAAWPVATQLLGLGLVHVANCAVVYLLVGYGAGRVLRARPTAARLVSRLSGAVMIAVGLLLLAERLLTLR